MKFATNILLLATTLFLFNDVSCSIVRKDSRIGKNIETLDDDGKVTLAWEVDEATGIITFEIEAQTLGYVGFGISPQGSMTGADIFIAGVDPDGKPYATVCFMYNTTLNSSHLYFVLCLKNSHSANCI